MEYLSNSTAETQKLASSLGKNAVKKGMIIGLTGDLGTGKTTFAQGFAKGLGIKATITSPTFTLIRQYQIPKTTKIFYHIDLYRLKNDSDFHQIGLTEILENKDNVVLVEWAEKLKPGLPTDATLIRIEKLSDTTRKISLKGRT